MHCMSLLRCQRAGARWRKDCARRQPGRGHRSSCVSGARAGLLPRTPYASTRPPCADMLLSSYDYTPRNLLFWIAGIRLCEVLGNQPQDFLPRAPAASALSSTTTTMPCVLTEHPLRTDCALMNQQQGICLDCVTADASVAATWLAKTQQQCQRKKKEINICL